MFGRVRSCPSSSSSSSSSLDSWESDVLPSSKILKLDSLSIYEATLMRLRAGSQVKLTSPPEQAEDMPSSVPTDLLRSCQLVEALPDDGDPMSIDTCCSSATARLNSGGCQSTGDLKESRSRNGSILYLFSKYKNPQNALSSSYQHAKTAVDHDSATTTSSSSSNYQSLGSTYGQTKQETSSCSVFQM